MENLALRYLSWKCIYLCSIKKLKFNLGVAWLNCIYRTKYMKRWLSILHLFGNDTMRWCQQFYGYRGKKKITNHWSFTINTFSSFLLLLLWYDSQNVCITVVLSVVTVILTVQTFGINFESPCHCRDNSSFSSLHYVLLVVLFWFQNNNVALWRKDATEQTKRWS